MKRAEDQETALAVCSTLDETASNDYIFMNKGQICTNIYTKAQNT